MPAVVPLLSDFDATKLRVVAKLMLGQLPNSPASGSRGGL